MDQRAELLRKLMDSKNMKVSDIVKISGLPYSTVKAILERGAEKAGYINVCKICNALGITADELERMVAENNYQPTTIAAHFDGDDFTEDELDEIEKLIRVLSDLRGEGKEVVLVSSGAIAAGRQAFGHHKRPDSLAEKQAFAAVGQARLMMVYQKLCSEYNQTAAQVLLTKDTMVNDSSRYNAQNTFDELLRLGAIPVVNENDTVSTSEIPYVDSFGDNDRLSAIVAALIGADLLILLSDIDGLYTDDPRSNPDAKFISLVPEISQKYLNMGKETSGSSVGTGGMSAKLAAARIATDSGADMVIANGDQVDVIMDIMSGKEKGTLFLAHPNLDFDLMHYLNNEY